MQPSWLLGPDHRPRIMDNAMITCENPETLINEPLAKLPKVVTPTKVGVQT
jgi:hypothetical protein